MSFHRAHWRSLLIAKFSRATVVLAALAALPAVSAFFGSGGESSKTGGQKTRLFNTDERV